MDVKTAAWLVENGHLTQLESLTLSTDLDTTSVWGELESITRVASTLLFTPNEEISKGCTLRIAILIILAVCQSLSPSVSVNCEISERNAENRNNISKHTF